MSFNRWGLAPLVAGFTLAFTGAVQAEDLEYRPNKPAVPPLAVADSDLGLKVDDGETFSVDALDSIQIGDLELIEDFHPETDRWTDRNNRIRISLWTGAWMFSNELRIHPDLAIGFRIAWEVPGFIGIRWDSGVVPWSRLKVVGDTQSASGTRSTRYMDGVVHNHTLSLAIFNPELSVSGLAFWAGFGAGLWIYDYQENDIFGVGAQEGINGSFNDTNISGHIFIELDYEVADIFHVGIGIRQHALLADHTDEGRFYEFNGIEQGTAGENDGQIDDLAGVTEITFNLSVLF